MSTRTTAITAGIRKVARGTLVIGALAALVVLLGSPAPASARSKPEKSEKSAEAEATKVKAGLHGEGGKVVERVFNLGNKKDRDDLAEAIKERHVESLEEIPKVDLLPKADLGIWTIVVFLVLFLILRAKAWPIILDNLHKREEGIKKAIEEAQSAREEAAKCRTELQAELGKAQDKEREILDEARKVAQRTTDEMLAKGRADIQAERDRLHREIDVARDQALQAIWTQTAQLATLVSAKAIRRTIGVDDHRRLVDEAIAELGVASGARKRETADIS